MPQRELVARIFTGNLLLPPQTFLGFNNSNDVGTYFGFNSEEYYRALFYFSWISKNNTQPLFIQFARWVNVATAPLIFPIAGATTLLANWTSITSGSFSLTIGATTHAITSMNFNAAGSLPAVAAIIQTAVQAADVSAQWADATVTYVSTGQNPGFQFVGGATGAATISVAAAGSGTPILGPTLLAWSPGAAQNNAYNVATYTANALWIAGAAVETIATTLNNTVNASNNFGSFTFLNNLNLTLPQVNQAALWNEALIETYLYSVPVTPANAATWASSAVGSVGLVGGTTLTLSNILLQQTGTISSSSPNVSGLVNALTTLAVGMVVQGTNIPANTYILSITDNQDIVLNNPATGSGSETLTFFISQYPEQCPMMIEAATNYNAQTSSVQNYMFNSFDPFLTPLVTSDSQANTYDALSVNYYGQTQTAGVQFNFYQRGVMCGSATYAHDQNVYVNEIWLKDAIGATLLQLLLNLAQLPANSQGASQALLAIQSVINQALINGVISVGKILTNLQQIYITNISGDPMAWHQVQNVGYWVDCVITPVPASSPLQYQANYILIYSKDDIIRFISGQDILV